MSNENTITLANHHPLHSSIFRQQFQEAHDKNVARHGPSPTVTPEPTPHLVPSATRETNHARPVIVYTAL